MKGLFIGSLVLGIFTADAQILTADSSVQVIGYWSKNDTQTYNIVSRKYKVKEKDTLDVETTKYQVDVKVVDSTKNSYTIEWFYRDSDIKLVVKTNEYGEFQDVLKSKERQDKVKKTFVETNAKPDILQYYTFHGAKYILHEDIKTKIISKSIPGKPVDVQMTVQLTEINTEEDDAVLYVWKDFDKQQMTDATYEVMKNLTKSTGVKMPMRDEIGEVTHTEYIGSRVHGSSGWILYSFQMKRTSTGGSATVEEREIEIL